MWITSPDPVRLHVALATAHLHAALLHEAIIVPHVQELLSLLDRIKSDTDNDQEAGTSEKERLNAKPLHNPKRHQSD